MLLLPLTDDLGGSLCGALFLALLILLSRWTRDRLLLAYLSRWKNHHAT